MADDETKNKNPQDRTIELVLCASSSFGATLIRLFSNHVTATAMETNRHKRAKNIILEVDIGSYYTTKTRGTFALRHTE